jgi:hypothetical protein
MNTERSTARHTNLVRPAHRCPEDGCTAPSFQTDRYVIESTDGPVEHLAVACGAGHRFHGAVSSLWPGR